MRALSLFAVFAAAKALALIGRDIPLSPWTPLAYLWQDALVALIFAGMVRLAGRRTWIAWSLYAALALYAALNVPVMRLLSTPITWPMLRGARGALADSVAHQATLTNLLMVGMVLVIAAVLPWLLPRGRIRMGRCVLIAALTLVAIGPLAGRQVDTLGRDRNVLTALLTSAFPRIRAEPHTGDWRTSLLPAEPGDDLSTYRGAAAGRNVLLVVLESTGAQHLKPYGAAEDPMPNLTDLAEQAIVFDRAYTVYPESIKGLFATLCSRYPALDTAPEQYAGIGNPSIADVLAERGYRTALFHSGRFVYLGMRSLVDNRGFHVLEDAADISGERYSSFGVDEPSAVQRILAWIDALPGGHPFFAAYLPIAGHHPYATPEPGPFPEDNDRGRYLNALRYGDAALGQLIEGLRERKLLNKTLIVAVGDHGEAFGQHDGNFGHMSFIYEENVRVPLIAALPGLLRQSVRALQLASTIDLPPMILDLLGQRIPPQWQGGSPLCPEPRMALFFTDYSLALLGLRDGPWKVIYEVESARTRLFNLEEDPLERRDLSAHLADRAAAYRAHLLRWSAAQRQRVLRQKGAAGTEPNR